MDQQALVIWNYHPQSGVLLGDGLADPDPLTPDAWLIPANATLQQPPTVGVGSLAVWKEGDGWTVVDDVRGVWYGAAGQIVEVIEVGADVSGLTRDAPPDANHDWDGAKWVLNTEKEAASFDRWRAAQLDAFRVARDGMLNQLAGVGMAALVDGQTATAQACAKLRKGLLDLPHRPDVLMQTTQGGFVAAMKAAYVDLLTDAPQELLAAMKKLELP